MANTNSVVISGRIAQDIELKYVSDGTAVTNLRLASDQGKDDTIFIDVSVFGKQAESINEYLSKGSAVTVTGQLRSRQYENKQGVKVTAYYIRAFTVEFGAKATSGDGAATAAPKAAVAKDDYEFTTADDPPF